MSGGLRTTDGVLTVAHMLDGCLIVDTNGMLAENAIDVDENSAPLPSILVSLEGCSQHIRSLLECDRAAAQDTRALSFVSECAQALEIAH